MESESTPLGLRQVFALSGREKIVSELLRQETSIREVLSLKMKVKSNRRNVACEFSELQFPCSERSRCPNMMPVR